MVYIYIYIYILHIYTTNLLRQEQVCSMMFNERYSFERNFFHHWKKLVKHFLDVINLLYYQHWTDKWKYIPYISDTQSAQVLQKQDDHFGTWCMWCAWRFFIVFKNLLATFIQGFPHWGSRGVVPPTKDLLIQPLPTKFLFPTTKSQFNPIES